MARIFEMDDKTAANVQKLQEKFGVSSLSEVLRRALALAFVAAQHSGTANTVVIRGEAEPLDKGVKVKLDE